LTLTLLTGSVPFKIFSFAHGDLLIPGLKFTPDPVTQPMLHRIMTLLARPMVGQFARFLMVGATATLTHSLILFLLVEYAHLKPQIGNAIGFCGGVTVSYILNSRFTFRAGAEAGNKASFRFARFLGVTGIGFFLNSLLFNLFHNMGLHYLVAQLMATAIVVFWNFFGSRLLVFFRHPHKTGSDA
jgi:putative flippase GtrA